MTRLRPALPLIVLAALSGCTPAPTVWPAQGVRVVVSFAPLDSFAKKVVGSRGTVRCLCEGPNGVHDFQPSPGDAMVLSHAHFLFANGLGLDDAKMDQLRANCGNPDLRYVKLGDLLPKSDLLKMRDAEETDPHVWLGVSRAVLMVGAIRDGLKAFDPGHAGDYDANAEGYIQELQGLLKEGRAEFARLKDRKLVSFHESLNYFAADFGLDVVGYVEPGPGVEPSAARYGDIVDLCKKDHVRVIATEQQYSDKAAENVRQELKNRGAGDVKLVRVDPLEAATADELADPDYYGKTMRKNIDDLAGGLK